jgi:general secretion pathway protein H
VSRGFTLLELAVALAIAAMVMLLVIPAGRHRRDQQAMSGAAHEIATAMRLARARAVATNRSAAIVVDVANAAWRTAGPVHALPRGTQVTLRTAGAEEITASEGAIRFYPDGSATGGGLTLARGDTRYEVEVDWLTGAVAVREESVGRRR